MIELSIQHDGIEYYPAVKSGIKLDFEIKSVPGKLTFDIIKDDVINFEEGDSVYLKVNSVNVFKGYVFTKKRNKEQIISVTAYDRLRYLKNKDTICYENMKASDLVKDIAQKIGIETGNIDDTGFVLESRIEDNTTYFDMIQNALDMTLRNKGKMYVLYDDFGKICLKDVEQMKLNMYIDEYGAEDFDYSTSIDNNTYNQVKLAYDNDKTKKREIFIVKDSNNIKQWGLLQYFEKVNENENAVAKADALLKLYNQRTKSLSISNVIGDVNIKAGNSVAIMLNLGDSNLNSYMVVEKVQHEFSEKGHFMKLNLIGGDFVA